MRLNDLLYEIEMKPVETAIQKQIRMKKEKLELKSIDMKDREVTLKLGDVETKEKEKEAIPDLLKQRQEKMAAQQKAIQTAQEKKIEADNLNKSAMAGVGDLTKLNSTSELDQTGLNQKPQPVNKVQETKPVRSKHKVKNPGGKLGESKMVGLKQMLKDRR